jgi:hypothetical protein
MNLKPLPGFNWEHVIWSRPDSPRPVLCSYCSAALAEDEAPLTMWDKKGFTVQFCDLCQETWWGMTTPKAEEDEC